MSKRAAPGTVVSRSSMVGLSIPRGRDISARAVPRVPTDTRAGNPRGGDRSADLSASASLPSAGRAAPIGQTILLVEDDPGDALLVEELVADGALGARLEHVRSLSEAGAWLAARLPDCVLLDLNLPDSQGLDALAQLREYTDQVAVVVMTGLDEEQTGLAAMAAGAEDYLVKGRVEPEWFGRAVRYAIQRKQAERTATALRATTMRAQENARLERGLLPKPLLRGEPVIDVVSRYRPGRAYSLLGGDFYDVIQEADGTVHALIGDVAGHGPDEAAIGVGLRLAWRTLVLSGVTGPRQLELLEQVLVAERTGPQIFATLTALYAPPGRGQVQVIRAGHPGMLVRRPGGTEWLEVRGGPALGFVPGRADWPVHHVDVPVGTGLVLFTDGLFEARTSTDGMRLEEEGLLSMAAAVSLDDPADYLDELLGRVEDAAAPAGGLDDDVAVVYLRWRERGNERER
ncbi:putative response regulator receiver protein [Nocardia nova SH22a]|uniref:Putative response regulator receiver protein n=1 Tax=Nocardia nova SH22a TaxID=1415166 RepID=W5TBR7_9NOCA|nr:fused response regulator/phosphatase [Nocardia nova]AHH16800.1 putative response regulator receiver protein [Nocardia nova SH22a]